MAIYLVIGAIIVAAAGAVLQALAASNSTAERRGRRTATLAIFAGLLTAVWVILLWFAQQRYTQEWNSRPVVEFYIDKEKRLNLENRGLVDIEDVAVFVSQYTLSEDYPRRTSKATILSHGTLSRAFERIPHVARNTTAQIDLKKMPTLLKFYPELPKPEETWLRDVYCLRVLFRNAISKERHVRYVLTSPSLILPDPFGDYRDAASGGGYEASVAILRLRDLIRSHESAFYDDRPNAFYRN